MKKEARDLISRLLTADLSRRIGECFGVLVLHLHSHCLFLARHMAMVSIEGFEIHCVAEFRL